MSDSGGFFSSTLGKKWLMAITGIILFGFVVGHITPEAAEGGPIALVEDGDTITIDAVTNRIELDVSEQILEQRRQNWQAPALRFERGVLAKYARTVSSASKGAVTDLP